MCDLFTYNEGVKYMKDLVKETGRGTINPYQDIRLTYPGKKKIGDYILKYRQKQYKHFDIANMLYESVMNNTSYNVEQLYEVLENVYYNGTTRLNEIENIELRNFGHLIFWMTLQEEINYPSISGCAGKKLAFCRYLEAFYAAENNSFNIAELKKRCNNHGNYKPELFDDIDFDIYKY